MRHDILKLRILRRGSEPLIFRVWLKPNKGNGLASIWLVWVGRPRSENLDMNVRMLETRSMISTVLYLTCNNIARKSRQSYLAT